jgi:Protein of unknown function (DUF2934)
MVEKAKKAVSKSKSNGNGAAKVPAKPRKKATGTNGNHTNVTEIGVSHEEVAMLAHRFWAERGHQHGHHEEDWYRAEEELRGRAS